MHEHVFMNTVLINMDLNKAHIPPEFSEIM